MDSVKEAEFRIDQADQFKFAAGPGECPDGKTGLAWVPDLQALAAWDDAERRWRAGTVGD